MPSYLQITMNAEPTMADASTFAPIQRAPTLAHVGQAMSSWSLTANPVKVCTVKGVPKHHKQLTYFHLNGVLAALLVIKQEQTDSTMHPSLSDINECLTGNGGCQHNCNNQPGTYSCSCNAGYALANDGTSCSGE